LVFATLTFVFIAVVIDEGYDDEYDEYDEYDGGSHSSGGSIGVYLSPGRGDAQ
jgi:hypothetical protein